MKSVGEHGIKIVGICNCEENISSPSASQR